MLSASRPAVTGVSLNQIELEAQNSMEFPLNVPAPRSFAYVKRNIPILSRREAQSRIFLRTASTFFLFPLFQSRRPVTSPTASTSIRITKTPPVTPTATMLIFGL